AIGMGKSTFKEKFRIYLKKREYKVYRPVEASLLLNEKLKLFCKDKKNNALFFQYAILNFYKKQATEINIIDSYDFVILDRTHIDTEPTDENMIERQQNRDRKAETYTKEYLINLSDFYEKLIDKIYPSHIKIENNCSVE
ncbi:24776_t:CDS:2, partial [Racocetra persica]